MTSREIFFKKPSQPLTEATPRIASPQPTEPFASPPDITTDNKTRRSKLLRTIGIKGTVITLSALAAFGQYKAWDVMQNEAPPSHQFIDLPDTEAELAYNMLIDKFSVESGLFSHRPHGEWSDAWKTTAWPHSNIFNAENTLERTHDFRGEPLMASGQRFDVNVQQTIIGTERYWDEDPKPPGYAPVPRSDDPVVNFIDNSRPEAGERMIDDGAWLALANLRAFRNIDPSEVNHELYHHGIVRAKQTFEQAMANQDADHGGIHWRYQFPYEDNDVRVVVSNAPIAQLGLRLRELSGDEDEREYYLDNSRRTYQWVRNTLLDPNDNLYYDNINGNQEIEKKKWTYCQGTMIGAGARLYEATGEEKYIEQAEKTAESYLEYYSSQENDIKNDPLNFIEISFRNLLYLSSVTSNQKLADDIESMVLGQALRFINDPDVYNKETHMVNFDHPPYRTESPAGQQGAFVGILSLAELVTEKGLSRNYKYASLI